MLYIHYPSFPAKSPMRSYNYYPILRKVKLGEAKYNKDKVTQWQNWDLSLRCIFRLHSQSFGYMGPRDGNRQLFW